MLQKIIAHNDILEFRYTDRPTEYEYHEIGVNLQVIKKIANKYKCDIIPIGVLSSYYSKVIDVERGTVDDNLISDRKIEKCKHDKSYTFKQNKCYKKDFE